MGCHSLLQGIFPTQGSNPHLFVSCAGRRVLYHLSQAPLKSCTFCDGTGHCTPILMSPTHPKPSLHVGWPPPLPGLPRWSQDKESAGPCRRRGSCRMDPWVGKIPRKRKWQSSPVFWPGEFHGPRSLAGYSPQRVRHK